jgi:hypothetical protein
MVSAWDVLTKIAIKLLCETRVDIDPKTNGQSTEEGEGR